MKVLYTNQFVFSSKDCWYQNWNKISFLSKNITKIIFTVPKKGFVRFLSNITIHPYPFFYWVLGIGYDMGIYPMPIPKIHNFLSISPIPIPKIPKNVVFGYEYWVDTHMSWVLWVWVLVIYLKNLVFWVWVLANTQYPIKKVGTDVWI
jgi:hypothetical protein